MTTKKLKLDVWEKNFVVISARKGEANSRFLEMTFLSGYNPVNLSKNTVVIYTKKPDGTIIFNDCEILDAENGIISVKLTAQMSSVIGNLNCEFQIIGENSEVLIVQGLVIKILQSEDDIPIESSSEYSELVRQIKELEDVNQKTAELLEEYQTDNFATKDQGIKADSAVQGIKLDGNLIPPDSENIVSIPGKTTDIEQTLGDSETSVISQNASTTLLAAKNHTHSLDEIEFNAPLTVTNGGTGLGNIPNDEILVGTGTDILKTVPLSDFSIPIAQEIGQSTTDVMSQKAVTDSILNPTALEGNGRVKINSTTRNVASAANITLIDSPGNNIIGANSILIGAPAIDKYGSGNAIGMGYNTTIAATSSVAIGNNAKTTKADSVAIGHYAECNAKNSVALGFQSIADEENVVSVGGNATYAPSRRITNVTDPQNPQDAATKAYVDESIPKIEISQEIGQSTTTVMSQKAVTDAILSGGDVTVDNLKNGYFVTTDTGAKNYISDMIEIPGWHSEMPSIIGMVSADSTNGSFYLQTTDGLNYQKYQIQTSGTGYGFKLTYNSDNGKLYAISGQNVFTAYSDMPFDWQKQTTASPHDDVTSPAWYSYENGIFFLSAGSQTPTPSGLWKSIDSLNWELITSMTNGWYCCKWLNGAYWACGLGVYKSTDGTNWEQILSPEDLGGSSKWAMNILYNDGKYVVMADWGAKYLTSTDGTSWTTITPNNPKPSSKFLIWDSENQVYCSVSNGKYYTSSNLETWKEVASYNSYQSPNSFMVSDKKVFIDFGQQYSGKIAIHNDAAPFILPFENGGTGLTNVEQNTFLVGGANNTIKALTIAEVKLLLGL